MRELLRLLLTRPVLWLVNRFSPKPDQERVFDALTQLHTEVSGEKPKKGIVIPFVANTGKFIIFSDQHKGARDGADDFALAEPNYLAALQHYNEASFHFINLGDGEELWENTLSQVKKFNKECFAAERKFIDRNAFTKIFGNHDLFWDNDPLAGFQLKNIYQTDVTIYEAVLLQTSFGSRPFTIFCAHGHQGDSQSDGNWFSKFFVSTIWGPFQSFLSINPNTPANSEELKTRHNQMMYEWSARQENILLITGHTHQPVFESLTHLERLFQRLSAARAANQLDEVRALQAEIKLRDYEADTFSTMKPFYFNTGCCCFNDGDITGIEISEGMIRLVKWEEQRGQSTRRVLEEAAMSEIAGKLA